MLRRLAAEFDESAALELMPAYHTFSGGNPLLLDALIEDRTLAMLTTPYLPAGEPVVGVAYRRAVLACLRRCDPVVAAVAAGVAVLGAAASPQRLHRLLGLAPDAVARAVGVLALAGLLQDGRFRHPAAPAAVLDGMPGVPRADLHLRALRLLRDEGLAGTVPLASQAGRPGRVGQTGPHRAAQHAVAGPGEQPRAGAAADLARLTFAERRVAALAAVGNTNREIARALFVTVSTVEQHLTRIYRKLNLKGRTELLRCS